jgi:hypothetical protein
LDLGESGLRLRAEADVQGAGGGERARRDHEQDDERREGESSRAEPAPRSCDRTERV